MSFIFALLTGLVLAQSGVTVSTPQPESTAALSASIRALLLQFMPETLYEASPGWGKTDRVPTGLKWKKKDGIPRPRVTRGERNDGTWRKIRITTDDLPQTLGFIVSNVRKIDSGRTEFDAFLSFEGRVHFQQQIWESGIRLYEGKIKAKFRIKLSMVCEVTSRWEKKDGSFPELVFRLRIVKANLRYDRLEFDHIAGVGGDAAKFIGKALHETVQEVHPSLEKKLLEKANAAIVKAGDTKEVHIGLKGIVRDEEKKLKKGG